MEPAKKELIKEIKDLFEDYEEAYVPGEWEAFSKTKSKKRVLFPQWLKIAAVLFMIAAALPFAVGEFFKDKTFRETVSVKRSAVNKAENKAEDRIVPNPLKASGDLAKEKSAEVAKGTSGAIGVSKNIGISEQIVQNRTGQKDESGADQPGIALTSGPQATDVITATSGNSTATIQKGEITRASANVPGTEVNTVPGKQEQSTMDFLLAEAKSGRTADIKKKVKTDKWNFGLEVMPTVMKSNVNVGAGITTAYRLSENFSISSGISMVKLESGAVLPQQTPNSQAAPGNQVSFASQSSRTLVSVDANISAIDIPIGIVYNVSKSFYTSVGISYFNILRDKRSNTYETTSSFYRMDTDPSTGFSENYQAVKSEAIAEPAVEAPMKGNSYLGFFNLSIGRDQRIFKQYHIMVEPFIKIPVGKLSSEDLNLMNSGVKFRLAF